MMSGWLQWILLTAVTGSPIGSAVALLVFWFVVDRFTLGVLPDPLRWLSRRRRAWALERLLRVNPHDRRARLELGELYVARNLGRRAVDVLRPNLEAGDDDIQNVAAMAEACLQAGFHEQGEKLLTHAEELSPEFRVGELFLIRGRYRLARGDAQGALAPLRQFVSIRKGTVRGRVMLAQALAATGDDAAAALLRDEAWHEFANAPRFVRRQERIWAWRARPSRPLLYLAAVVAVLLLLFTVVGPWLSSFTGAPNEPWDD